MTIVTVVILSGVFSYLAYLWWDASQKEGAAFDIVTQLRTEGLFNLPLTPEYLVDNIGSDLHPRFAQKILARLEYNGEIVWDDTACAHFVLVKKRMKE